MIKYLKLYTLIVICCIENGCSRKHISNKPYWKPETSVNFLVVGDWGRNGEFEQKTVANQMAIESKKKSSLFILSMGDNFYPDGVISTQDPQWNKSYEDIYFQYSLNIPWYTAFGNHDYRGNIDAQLEYSKVSRRWRTEKRYYSFEKTIPNSTKKAIFIFIDTNPFDATLNPIKHSDIAKQDTSAQLKWLDKILSETKADWKIVIGHHPLYTTGVRKGLMLDVRKAFLPIFEKHKVDIYFAGHEHDLQHQKPNGHTNYFVSGAGSEIRPVTKDSSMTKFAISDYGFMSVQIKSDTVFLQTINYKGKLLYKTIIPKL